MSVVVLVLGMVLVLMLPLLVVMGLVIFGFRKKTEGAQTTEHVATAKSQGASSRSSQEINDGKYIWFLLLLSLN